MGIKALGNEPIGSAPDEFAALFRSDVERFQQVVDEAQIPKIN